MRPAYLVGIVLCAASWILLGVTIVHDGYTRLIKLQNDGYAYIGGFE